jgi:proteasome lid subunit RPN8/RPN11
MSYVIIDPECFFSMVFSSIEVYNRETTGFILGKKRRRSIHRKMETVVACEIAYPLQTASRKPTSVTKGNIRAFERIRALVPSLNLSLIGEYHSYPYMGATLSKDDIDYIKERMEQIYETGENLIKNHWLELVISIRQRHYENPHEIGWKWSDYSNKARCIVTLNPYIGYDLTFGGYWVHLEDNRIKTDETTIYIPWMKGYWS